MNLQKMISTLILLLVSGASSHNPKTDPPPKTIIGMMPVQREKADSFPMQQHCIDVAYHAVQKLNPGQVLVYEADQPLYAIILQKKFKYLCRVWIRQDI